MTPEAVVPLAVTVRSGAVESVHHGAVVVLDSSGAVVASLGDPATIVYPRSSNKPFQAVGMLRLGLELAPDELALACASHAGTDRHLAVVRRVLDRFELSEDDLANTPGWPLDVDAAADAVRAGAGERRVTMNCSGKHAAMLATCRVNGWPILGYLHEAHPLQVSLTATIAELGGEPVSSIGIDGCGAPAHRISLVALARATSAVASSRAGSEVAAAMTTHPDLVDGPGRESTRWMQAVPGLVAKNGAEGVMIAGLPDGGAVAVKIADGSDRARRVVTAAGLARLGVDVASIDDVWRVPVLGHGHPVGEVIAHGELAAWLGRAVGPAAL